MNTNKEKNKIPVGGNITADELLSDKLKLLSKPDEVTCPCGNKYHELYEPPKRYIPVCDACLPF